MAKPQALCYKEKPNTKDHTIYDTTYKKFLDEIFRETESISVLLRVGKWNEWLTTKWLSFGGDKNVPKLGCSDDCVTVEIY